ncbi:glycoside hydrolase family 30 protein [Bacteroides sp.]|uniref:glycoside hydrolase family 30 protein n=1 Tax=Bacteroides sp. TaxID=29523 RepID=UPI00262D7A47|nr:glycoside hydrolase family 30 protein [Bacteroides sp.]MDD3036832.1 glycoside hydrolase family 30 protein [Bacteroides sp.]
MKMRLLVTSIGIWLMNMTAGAQPAISFQIETSKPCQVIEHFGASDAWSMQFIGLWPQEKQDQVADWLFSTENDENGQPKGIGLSLWRFNIGAGSAEQGSASGISSPWRRAECFLQADGTYDWTKQQGQRNFLRLAKERGVDKFLAFLNSPPVFYTQNGLATNTGRGGTANLKPDCYENYVHFLADVVQGVKEHDDIKFSYICPFNEPDGHWNWTGSSQEGCPATNREIAHTVRLLNKEFTDRKIDTEVLVNESSDYRCMFSTHMTDWQRGYQIQSFFRPDSVNTYLGDVSKTPRLMVGHSYWTNTPLSALRHIRSQLRDTLDKYKVDFWQTEVCIMSNDEEIGGGGGFDPTMKTALYVARMIHHDIVYAGAKSWQWWRAIGEDYKDGLIRELADDDFRNGRVEDSKLMWVLGNYSRFIRPGAVRLTVSAFDNTGKLVPEGDTDQKGLMCSAYKNTDGKYVVVLINYANEDKEYSIGKGNAKKTEWQVYSTSDREGENLKPVAKIKGRKVNRIPARSVITLLSE